jgi:hypothetical protein
MLDFALKSDKNPLFIIIDCITNSQTAQTFYSTVKISHYMMRHCRSSQ